MFVFGREKTIPSLRSQVTTTKTVRRCFYSDSYPDNVPFTEPFKLALRVEIKAWKLLFGHSINEKYKRSMDEITQFVNDNSKRLGRQINDLEDVRNAMAALEDIRQNEIRIDMILEPIEVRFPMILCLVINYLFNLRGGRSKV